MPSDPREQLLARLRSCGLLSPQQFEQFVLELSSPESRPAASTLGAERADAATVVLPAKRDGHSAHSSGRSPLPAPGISSGNRSPGEAASPEEKIERVATSSAGSTAPATELNTPDQIAAELVRRDWLTRWQADRLLAGATAFYLGRYRLLEQIGSGGMGAVFRALHTGLGRTVAIKIIGRQFVRDPELLARFYQEIRAAAALNHEHIVAAYDADSIGDTHFLVMEYVDGIDLSAWLEREPIPPLSWTLEVARQIALGLQHACEQGMVHRDIKPANILVTRDPETDLLRVKILDFGLARVVSESALDDRGLTQTGQVLGTPDYISPEQAADTRTADIRSDLFSLGVTLFRMLTGKLPFGGHSVMEKLMARAMKPAPPLRSLRPDLAPHLDRVVARLLDRDASQRFQTPVEFIQEIARDCHPIPFRLPVPAAAAARHLIAIADSRAAAALPSSIDRSGPAAGDPISAVANSVSTPTGRELERFLAQLSLPGSADLGRETEQYGEKFPFSGLSSAGSLERLNHSATPSGSLLSPATDAEQSPRGLVPLRSGSAVSTSPDSTETGERNPLATNERALSTTSNARPHRALIAGARNYFARHPAMLLTAAIGLLLLMGLASQSALFSSSATLQIDWPQVERQSAKLLIDGREVALSQSDSIRWTGPSGRRELIARRAGFGEIKTAIDLTPGRVTNWKPSWIAAAAGSQNQELNRLHEQVGRLRSTDPADPQVSAIRSSLLDVLHRHPGTESGQQAARLLMELPGWLDRLAPLLPSQEIWKESGLEPWQNSLKDAVAILGDGRLRHAHEVTAVTLSDDGRQIASAGKDRTVRLWSTETGRLQRLLPVREPVYALKYLPRARQLLVVDASQRLTSWNCDTGEREFELAGLSAPLACTRAGTSIAAAQQAGGILVYDIATRTSRRLPLSRNDPCEQLLFSPDDAWLVTTLRSGRMLSFRTSDWQEQRTWPNARQPVFHPTKPWVAFGGPDRDVYLTDLSDQDFQTPRLFDEAELPIHFDRTGERLLTQRGSHVTVWEVAQSRELKTIQDAGDQNRLSPDGSMLISADASFGWLRFRSISQRTDLSIPAHARGITALALDPDSGLLVTASRDHRLKLWNAQSGTERLASDVGILAADFSPDAGQILLALDDGTLKIWDVSSRQFSKTLTSGARDFRWVRFSPNGRWIAAIADWGYFRWTCRVWDAATGREVSLPGDAFRQVTVAEFLSQFDTLAVVSGERTARVLNLKSQAVLQEFDDAPDSVLSIAVDPLAQTLAIGSDNQRVTLEPLQSQSDLAASDPQRKARLLNLPAGQPISLRFAPVGQSLLIGTNQGQLWSAADATSQSLHIIDTDGTSPISSITVAPAQTHLLLGTEQGKLQLLEWTSDPISAAPKTSPHTTRGDKQSRNAPSRRTLIVGPPAGLIRDCRWAADSRHALVVHGNGTLTVLRLLPRIPRRTELLPTEDSGPLN